MPIRPEAQQVGLLEVLVRQYPVWDSPRAHLLRWPLLLLAVEAQRLLYEQVEDLDVGNLDLSAKHCSV